MSVEMTHHRSLKIAPTALLLGCLVIGSAAHAGDVTYIPVEASESEIVMDLGETFTRYAWGLDRWLKIEAPKIPQITHARVFGSFEGGFKRATVARLEYTFEKNGVMQTVTYHAMSGTEPDEAFTRLLSNINKLPPTPLSPAADQFASQDDLSRNVRSISIEDDESELRATETADGLNHAGDAELKGLRNLEREIVDGTVTPAGRLVVRVSQMPCQSCRTVFDRMTDLYPDMEVEVAYPMAGSSAYTAFDEYRKIAFHVVKASRLSTEPTRSLQDFEMALPRPPCP
jgi:hypothetical protein